MLHASLYRLSFFFFWCDGASLPVIKEQKQVMTTIYVEWCAFWRLHEAQHALNQSPVFWHSCRVLVVEKKVGGRRLPNVHSVAETTLRATSREFCQISTSLEQDDVELDTKVDATCVETNTDPRETSPQRTGFWAGSVKALTGVELLLWECWCAPKWHVLGVF